MDEEKNSYEELLWIKEGNRNTNRKNIRWFREMLTFDTIRVCENPNTIGLHVANANVTGGIVARSTLSGKINSPLTPNMCRRAIFHTFTKSQIRFHPLSHSS